MEGLPLCVPYRIPTPIQAKVTYLELDDKGARVREVTKEGTISDVLHLLDL